MSKYNKTILTDKGLELAKKANAGKAKFKITRALTSSEDLSRKTITELQALTDLPTPVQEGTILDAEPTETDNAIIAVSLRFTNKDLTNSYPIRAVGLYVKEEGQDTDFLYALSTAQEPEFMPDFSDQVLYRFNINMYVVVGRVQNVTVEVLDGTSVPYEAFNRHIKEAKARFEDLERTRAKSATVNGGEKVLPDDEGNLALTVPDPDLSSYGKVKSVQGASPDDSGNVTLPTVPVTTDYNLDTKEPTTEHRAYGDYWPVDQQVLKKIVDAINRALSKAGGTMDRSSTIHWEGGQIDEILGNIGGLTWSSNTDSAAIFADSNANDNLDLVFELGDDASNKISIRNNRNREVASITAHGLFTGFINWDHVNGKPDLAKSATVNGGAKVTPDADGNLALTVQDPRVFVTQAEYDALSTEEKNNGKIYVIYYEE